MDTDPRLLLKTVKWLGWNLVQIASLCTHGIVMPRCGDLNETWNSQSEQWGNVAPYQPVASSTPCHRGPLKAAMLHSPCSFPNSHILGLPVTSKTSSRNQEPPQDTLYILCTSGWEGSSHIKLPKAQTTQTFCDEIEGKPQVRVLPDQIQ